MFVGYPQSRAVSDRMSRRLPEPEHKIIRYNDVYLWVNNNEQPHWKQGIQSTGNWASGRVQVLGSEEEG